MSARKKHGAKYKNNVIIIGGEVKFRNFNTTYRKINNQGSNERLLS